MAINQYKKEPLKMVCTGLDLTHPPDLLPEGKFRRLDNVRSDYEFGTLQTRNGLVKVNPNAMAGEVHSIRRLNDNSGADGSFNNPDFTYIVGAGTRVYDGSGVMNLHLNFTFSGRPLSMIPWRPSTSPKTYMYVYGDDAQCKLGRLFPPSATYVAMNIGIFPPNTEVLIDSGGVPGYQYVSRFRSSATGAVSNPSPVPTANGNGGPGTVVRSQFSNDIQVDLIDFFRFGNTVLDFKYTGSVANGNGGGGFSVPFTDTKSDADLQAEAEIVRLDAYMPFVVVTQPISVLGAVTDNDYHAGLTKVVATLAGSFPLQMIPGTLVTITSGLTSVTLPVFVYGTDTTIYLRGVSGLAGVGLTIIVQEPTIQAKPLPFAWGPFDGTTIFACGDKYNPGTLYWTVGNDPDSHDPQNSIEVTPPSEPLMGGFTKDGRAFVFSNERLFVIQPAFSGEGFSVFETPCNRGLLYNWAFCLEGEKQDGKVWFLAKDGIYETDGGVARCITDRDLYGLFPHEGVYSVHPPPIANLEAINFTSHLHTKFRLEHNQGKVYFDYVDNLGNQQTLVYDTRVDGWFHDGYNIPGGYGLSGLGMHYGEEGREYADLLAGASNGHFYRYSPVHTDDGNSITCNAVTKSVDFADPGVEKFYGDIIYEYESPSWVVNLTAIYNNELENDPAVVAPVQSGRGQRILDINRLARNIALRFNWVSVNNALTKIFMWLPSAIPKPEFSAKRIVDWHPFIEGQADSYVIGLVIHCDTSLAGAIAAKTVQVWSDEVFTGNTLTIQSNGEGKLEFSWPVFKGKLARLVPTDAGPWKVFSWEWVATPEPLLVSKWDTNWKDAISSSQVGYVTGVTLETDTLGIAKTVIFQSELEGTVNVLAPLSGSSVVNTSSRQNTTFSFQPFRAQQLRMYSLDNVVGRLYDVQWHVQPTEPNRLSNWDANYTDDGYLGAKFVQGVVIDADTEGKNKTVTAEFEDGIIETFTVNHTKRMGRPYSFIYPAIANKLRLIPTDPNPSWLYGVRWVWVKAPELVTNWRTQKTSHGLIGWQHIRDGYIPIQSYDTTYLTLRFENDTYSIALPSTNGNISKIYVVLKPTKFKLVDYQVSAFLPFDSNVLYTATL